MKISVFDKIRIPKNKEEKKALAYFASSPHRPRNVRSDNLETLVDIITKVGWSPYLYEGFRKQKNFKSADFLVLDIDDGLTIEEALSRIEKLDLFCVCLTTASHKKQHHRFRLVFPLLNRIEQKQILKDTVQKLYLKFPESDPNCLTDLARFYFPCNLSDEGFIYDGKNLIVPEPEKQNKKVVLKKKKTVVSSDIQNIVCELYGEEKKFIPECVDFFIKNAESGIPGQWWNSLNNFVFVLALQGLEYSVIYNIVSILSPAELDDNDERCIEYAFSDGNDLYQQEKEEK